MVRLVFSAAAFLMVVTGCSPKHDGAPRTDASSLAKATTTFGAGLAAQSSATPSAAPATSVDPTIDAAVPSPTADASAPPFAAQDAGLPEEMALVPEGPFTMGANSGGEPDEHPAHTVTLPAFLLDRSETTNEEWSQCVAQGVCPAPDPRSAVSNGFGSDQPFRGPKQPVSSVSWDAAKAYCAWRGKRLPTEAEWEKAARGTDGRRYPWGNEEPNHDRTVFGGKLPENVGSHPKGDGPYGHHDMAGNVWEWLEDAYDPYAYKRPGAAVGAVGKCDEAMAALNELREKGLQGFTGSNPIPTECEHVLRGGAFNYPGAGLRSSNRVHHPGRFRLVMAGVRCARDFRG